jgi:hypothetical protein
MNDLDRELDAALARLRDEALPESALASVRAGVRERIEVGRRKRVWTAWLSLAAAAAVAWIALAIPWTVSTLRLAAPRTPDVASIALARPASSMTAGSGGIAEPSVMQPEARLKPGRSLKAAPPRGASSRAAALEKVRREPGIPPPEPVREEQTQFMRIITDDPNVVILWAMNSKGETR